MLSLSSIVQVVVNASSPVSSGSSFSTGLILAPSASAAGGSGYCLLPPAAGAGAFPDGKPAPARRLPERLPLLPLPAEPGFLRARRGRKRLAGPAAPVRGGPAGGSPPDSAAPGDLSGASSARALSGVGKLEGAPPAPGRSGHPAAPAHPGNGFRALGLRGGAAAGDPDPSLILPRRISPAR